MKTGKSPFSNIRGELKKSSYFRQLLYTYTLVSCLLFFIFSALIVFYTNKDYRDTLIDQQNRGIEQSYQVNQTVLQDVYGTCTTLLNGVDLPRILYNAEYPVELSLKSKQLMDQIRQASSIVYSVYFVNFEAGTIQDSFTRGKIEDHYDRGLVDFLTGHKADRSPFYGLARTVQRTNSYASSNAKIFSLIIHPSTRGALVVNFYYDSYMRLLQTDSSGYISLLQVDRTGHVMTAAGSYLPGIASGEPDDTAFDAAGSCLGADLGSNALYTKISQDPATSGSFSAKVGGKSCLVMYRHNLGQGITYISILNQNAIYTANHLLWVVLLCGIAFIVIGLVAALGISVLVYRPFHSFKEQLSSHSGMPLSPQGGETDEFAYLSGIYRDIVQANEKLRSESQALLKEKDRAVLRSLLTGSDAGALIPAEYESLDQHFEKSLYQTLIISIDFHFRQQEDTAGLGLLRYSITNVFNELFEDKFNFMLMDVASPDVVYVINHDDESGTGLLSLIEKGKTFFQEYFRITLSFGVGVTVKDLDDLNTSFYGAQEALKQRFLTGNGKIHLASALEQKPIGEQHYPHAEDSAIISAMRTLSPEDVKAELSAFFATIRGFRFDQILRALLQLDTTLQRFESAQELTGEPLPWELTVISQLDIDTIHAYFERRCLADISELSEIRKHSAEKNELVENIIRKVEENLLDPNLSVASLADEVELSVNYLRSIFKENTGESLSAYITRKKVELICHLLKDTDESIQGISDRMGFSTKNYFFTFFKKHMNMTPNEYRKGMSEGVSEGDLPH